MRVLGSTPSGGTYVTKADVKSAMRKVASDAGLKAGTAARDRVVVDGKEVDRYRLPVTGGYLETFRRPGALIVLHLESGSAPAAPEPASAPAPAPASAPAPRPGRKVKGQVESKPVPPSAGDVRGSAILDEIAELAALAPMPVREGLCVALGLPAYTDPGVIASTVVAQGLASVAIDILTTYESLEDFTDDADDADEDDADDADDADDDLDLDALADALGSGDDDLPF